MPLGLEVGLGQRDFVLVGDPAPPPKKKGRAQPLLQFLTYVSYGQLLDESRCHLVRRWASAYETLC